MGIEISGVLIGPNDKDVELVNKGIKVPPAKIPVLSKVKNLNISGNSIKDLPQGLTSLRNLQIRNNELASVNDKIVQAVRTYSNLEKLDLSFNLLTKISPELLSHPKLKRVLLYDNKLTDIECNSDTITYLDLGKNKFTSCPKLPKSLTAISLDCNKIHVFDAESSVLTRISLRYNSLRQLSHNCKFSSLFSIDLSHNKLDKLPNLRGICPRLRYLDVSYNFLQYIPVLPRTVTDINFSYNKLSSIPAHINTLSCLITLDISHNSITELPQLPPSLHTLYANDNLIAKVAHSHVPELRRLFLMRNNLPACPLYKSQFLCEIFFSSNRIRFINVDVMAHQIHFLDVSNSKLDEIPERIFELPYLTTLLANNNQIPTLSPKITKSSLVVLSISHNPIIALPPLPKTLEDLNLSYCGFKKLYDCISDLPDLISLNASGNELSDIPLMLTLKYLRLAHNRFTEFPFVSPTIILLDLSYNQISKIPSNFTSPLLQHFDISFNKLIKAPKLIVMPSLITCKINDNEISGKITIGPNSLTLLNISDTSIDRVVGNVWPQIFISSKYPDVPGFTVTNSPGVFYKSSCGKLSPCEDFLIIRQNIKPGMTMMAIVDGRGSTAAALEYAVALITNMSKHRNPFDTESLKSVIESTVQHVDKCGHTQFISCGVTLIKHDAIICAKIGDSPIILFSNGRQRRIANQTGRYAFYATSNESTGQIGSLNFLEEAIARGKVPKIDIEKVTISPNDRFLVMTSGSVVDSIAERDLTSLVNEMPDAYSATVAIHDQALSNMCTDNISVIVADIKTLVQSYD